MKDWELEWYDTLESTNRTAREATLPQGGAWKVIFAKNQTAGRGQAGNAWESAPGQNVTLTIAGDMGVEQGEQFAVCEAVSLGMAEVIDHYATGVSVKWPNDLYITLPEEQPGIVGGRGGRYRKVGGILIEHDIYGGKIARTLVGIGLNVNQKKWESDAPNPIGLADLAGRELDIREVTEAVCDAVVKRLKTRDVEGLHEAYCKRLLQRQRAWRYRDARGVFTGEWMGIEHSGHIVLRQVESGRIERYAFKEVEMEM